MNILKSYVGVGGSAQVGIVLAYKLKALSLILGTPPKKIICRLRYLNFLYLVVIQPILAKVTELRLACVSVKAYSLCPGERD